MFRNTTAESQEKYLTFCTGSAGAEASSTEEKLSQQQIFPNKCNQVSDVWRLLCLQPTHNEIPHKTIHDSLYVLLQYPADRRCLLLDAGGLGLLLPALPRLGPHQQGLQVSRMVL